MSGHPPQPDSRLHINFPPPLFLPFPMSLAASSVLSPPHDFSYRVPSRGDVFISLPLQRTINNRRPISDLDAPHGDPPFPLRCKSFSRWFAPKREIPFDDDMPCEFVTMNSLIVRGEDIFVFPIPLLSLFFSPP